MSAITEIGQVTDLCRYPVKSMRGESIPSIDVRWTGFDGDRQYAFCKTGDKSRFPWLTGRDLSELVLFKAAYNDSTDTRGSGVRVTAPTGERFDITSPDLVALLSGAAKTDVALLQVGRGTFDSMPISVLGRDTVSALEVAYGATVTPHRFRSNIIIDRGRERDWIGGCLIFGNPETGVRLRINEPIERCSMVTIDPATATREPKLMRTVAQDFQNEIGVYGVAERLGQLSPGMRVWLERP